jgi:quinoprotein glucose dehydrogenase
VDICCLPSLLIIGQEGSTQREGGSPSDVPKFQIVSPNLTAFEKGTGKRVAEVALPHNATAAPMTYMHKGKQFIVVATGGANQETELLGRGRSGLGGDVAIDIRWATTGDPHSFI